MKAILLSLAAALTLAGAASLPSRADSQADEVRALLRKGGAPAVPTGYTVPGATHYVQRPGSAAVVQVNCDSTRAWTDKATAAKCERAADIDRPGREPDAGKK